MSDSYIFSGSLVVVCLLVYHNSYDCGFVFDDVTAIKDNKDLRPQKSIIDLFFNDFWGTPMNSDRSHKSYRPLTVLTFRWNYAFGELNPAGYHIVNVVLHIFSTLCFFRFCCDYLLEIFAFVSALIFAVHPIHTEAVTGVVGRAELLSAIFFLGTLLLYRSCAKISNMTHKDWIKVLLSAALVVMGTLCKEQCITVVAVCVAFEFFCVQELTLQKLCDLLSSSSQSKHFSKEQQPSSTGTIVSRFKLTFIRCVLLTGLTGGLLYARIKVMGAQLPVFTNFDNPAAHSPSPTRQLTFNYLLPVNMWMLLCPSQLCCDWTMGTIPVITSLNDPRNLATLAFYLIMAKLCWTAVTGGGRHSATLGMGLALLVLPFLPASNFFFPVGFVVAERVLYTPSMGVCLIVGLGLQIAVDKYPDHKKNIQAVIVFIVLLFSFKTYLRNFDWKSEYTLFRSSLRVNTQNAKLWNNVGHTFEGTDRFEDALKYFKQAVKVQPDDIGALINVGRTYVNLQMPTEAEEYYKIALDLFPKPKKGTSYNSRLAPQHLKIFINLSNLLIKNASRLEEADAYLRRAISMRPDFVDAYQNRGDILIKMKRHKEAMEQFRIALHYEPDNADMYYNLGVSYLTLNSRSDALQNFMKSIHYNPNHQQATYNAAALLSESKDPNHRAKSKSMFHKLSELKFEEAQCYFSLAMMETDDKNFEQAEKLYLKSLDISPIQRTSLFNLALLYRSEKNEPLKALPFIRDLLTHYPDHVKGFLLMGDIQMSKLKDFDGALKSFKKAYELEPSSALALHNICVVLVEMGHLDEGESCLLKAMKMAPQEEYMRQHLKLVRKRKLEQKHKHDHMEALPQQTIPSTDESPTVEGGESRTAQESEQQATPTAKSLPKTDTKPTDTSKKP